MSGASDLISGLQKIFSPGSEPITVNQSQSAPQATGMRIPSLSTTSDASTQLSSSTLKVGSTVVNGEVVSPEDYPSSSIVAMSAYLERYSRPSDALRDIVLRLSVTPFTGGQLLSFIRNQTTRGL